MIRIYIPATGPDDWQQFLKDPVKHWRTGYSAKTLAYSWHAADPWPQEIEHRRVLPNGQRATRAFHRRWAT